MKINTLINKAKGTKRTLDISVVEGGYVRTYGGMLAIGYQNERGQKFELAATIEDCMRVLEKAGEQE